MHLNHFRPHQLHDAVARGLPLLIPAGCMECHGPHLPIGYDTIIVEEVCRRLAERVECVIAPPFDYGPTGYAVSGPEMGTIDPDYPSFGLHVKSVLRAFCEMGFGTIVIIIQHQGMEAPLAIAFKKAAAELAFERTLEERPRGWWGERSLTPEESRQIWGRIHVRPLLLPAACPPAHGDHGGYYETSLLLACRPDLVEQDRLDENAPWYCHMGEEKGSATATAEQGRVMLEAIVQAWVEELSQLAG
jgi:creatinine amidohydrolase